MISFAEMERLNPELLRARLAVERIMAEERARGEDGYGLIITPAVQRVIDTVEGRNKPVHDWMKEGF